MRNRKRGQRGKKRTVPPALVRVNGVMVEYKAAPTGLSRTRKYRWQDCKKLNWTMTDDGYVADARE